MRTTRQSAALTTFAGKNQQVLLKIWRTALFASRFKKLTAEYEARHSCVQRIEQSFREMALPGMAQAPSIISSMTDVMEADIKALSVAQSQLVDLAEKINLSRGAIVTLQKIHRAMCARKQSARFNAANPSTLLERTSPFLNR